MINDFIKSDIISLKGKSGFNLIVSNWYWSITSEWNLNGLCYGFEKLIASPLIKCKI